MSDMFRPSAGADDPMEFRPRAANGNGPPRPPSVEILEEGRNMQPPAHNPNPVRVTLSQESLISIQTVHPSIMANNAPNADMRIASDHGRSGFDVPAHYSTNQPERQLSVSPYYIPPNIQNRPMGHQQSSTSAKRHQQPAIAVGAKVPRQESASITIRPISGNAPRHLSTVHGNNQRGVNSPSVGGSDAWVFPGHPQIYPASGLPQQQHSNRQATSNAHAELGSPQLVNIYDRGAIAIAAAANAPREQERERPREMAAPLEPSYPITGRPHRNLSFGEAGLGNSLLQVLEKHPIMWKGSLELKSQSAVVQMHFVSGSLDVAHDSLPSNPDGPNPPLRIAQRMRLEENQLESIARKLKIKGEHCMLLALPCGNDHMGVLHQSNQLKHEFISYLQLKQAAGVINVYHPNSQQEAYMIHVFPACDFAIENLAKHSPGLVSGVVDADIAHLLIVITTI